MSTGKSITEVDDYNKIENSIDPLSSDSNSNGLNQEDDQASISNDDTSPHISIESETIATNDSLSNISTDNNGNQSMDLSNTSTPSSSSVILRNNNRTKLSTQNVRILLYFIFEVKPFKYIGDRSINQTKKWETIQKKYAQTRKRESYDSDFVVPTVRTLQRQLASAIKKAKLKKEIMSNKGIKTSEEDICTLFQSIGPDSPSEKLELALLELHEYSERLKNGKASNTPLKLDTPKKNPTQLAALNSKSLDLLGASNKIDLKDPISQEKLDERREESSELLDHYKSNSLIQKDSNSLDELTRTRNKITKILGPSLQSLNISKLVEMIELLVTQTHQFQEKMTYENNRIIRETSEKIIEHQKHCERLVKANNKLQEDQNSTNKGLLITILSNMTKPSSSNSNYIENNGNDGKNAKITLNDTNINGNENNNASHANIFKSLQNI